MLGKLLKYEIKSTARLFLPFYAAVIALSILNRILFILLDGIDLLNIPRVIAMVTYVFLIIATFVLTFIVVIQRFYKNLLSEEGYLSMTLPVKTSSHILSKGITAFIWILSTVLSTVLSIIIMLPNLDFISDISKYWGLISMTVKQYTGMSISLLIVLGFAFVLVASISSILMIYTAISFGQLSNKHKVLTSFGAYVGIYAVIQTVNMVVISILAKSSDLTLLDNSNMPPHFIPTILITELCIQLVFCVAYFFTTRHILDKKLNLQ